MLGLNRCFSQGKKRFPGLLPMESLIFDRSIPGTSGVDFPDFVEQPNDLGDLARKDPLNLPSLSEVDVTRHYVRLSRLNYSLDQGVYPLGSCTMKFNPRANEAVIRQKGFTDIHPMQPVKTVKGALEALQSISNLLLDYTGMKGITLNPAAGAHGELTGIMSISEALIRRGEKSKRNVILVPDAAHGTNPASSSMCGFTIKAVKSGKNGNVSVDEVRKSVNERVAAMMLTNPNTCGLFERDVRKIADLLHDNGSYLYMDGANMNALFGRVNIHELGVDAMHLNLHKSFSTPHGGGGPGSGPVLFSERLMKHMPFPIVNDGLTEANPSESLGRVKCWHGQFLVILRALAYILALGGDGLKQSSADAVMNANYVKEMLKDHIQVAFPDKICMHEVLFTDQKFTPKFTTMDLAKAMADAGFHPPTVYFPLIVSGAMLFEPTESESKASLDEIIASMKEIIEEAQRDAKTIHNRPTACPIGRPDETRAARKPILKA